MTVKANIIIKNSNNSNIKLDKDFETLEQLMQYLDSQKIEVLDFAYNTVSNSLIIYVN